MMQNQDPLQDILHYHFSDDTLLREALEVAGACDQPGAITGNNEGNKRLALLGDAVIRLLILDGWYLKKTPIREYLTRKSASRMTYSVASGVGEDAVQSSASNMALCQLAQKHGLEEYVTKNPCQKGDVSDYTLATTVEALLGAVWIDSRKDLKVIEQVVGEMRMVKK